jgi:hypothetical protein
LPVAFIAHYSAFFLYLPMAGWSLYAAVLLVMARRFLVRLLVRLGRLHPFAKDEYTLLFLTRLLYRDMSITVEEAPVDHGPPTGHGHYDAVFTFQQGRLADATIVSPTR